MDQLYYSSDAIFSNILEKENDIFHSKENTPFRRGKTPFERYNAPRRAKIGTNDVTLRYKLLKFQTSDKPKDDQFNKCYI